MGRRFESARARHDFKNYPPDSEIYRNRPTHPALAGSRRDGLAERVHQPVRPAEDRDGEHEIEHLRLAEAGRAQSLHILRRGSGRAGGEVGREMHDRPLALRNPPCVLGKHRRDRIGRLALRGARFAERDRRQIGPLFQRLGGEFAHHFAHRAASTSLSPAITRAW